MNFIKIWVNWNEYFWIEITIYFNIKMGELSIVAGKFYHPIIICFREARVAEWWERSPLTNVAWVRFWPGVIMLVKFVVGSRPCPEGFSPGTPVFLPPAKKTAFQIPIRIEDPHENQLEQIWLPLSYKYSIFFCKCLKAKPQTHAVKGKNEKEKGKKKVNSRLKQKNKSSKNAPCEDRTHDLQISDPDYETDALPTALTRHLLWRQVVTYQQVALRTLISAEASYSAEIATTKCGIFCDTTMQFFSSILLSLKCLQSLHWARQSREILSYIQFVFVAIQSQGRNFRQLVWKLYGENLEVNPIDKTFYLNRIALRIIRLTVILI